MRTRHLLPLSLLTLASALPVRAQLLTVSAGSSMTITDSVVYVPGTVQSAGTLRTRGGRLFIENGDFLSSGDSRPGTGRVRLEDASAARTVSLAGDSLYRLQLNVPAGTTLGSGAVLTGALDLLSGHLSTTTTFQLRLAPGAVVNGETTTRFVRGSLVQQRTVSGAAPVDFGGMGVTLNPAGQNLTVEVDRRSGLNTLNYSFGQNPSGAMSQGIDNIWRLSTPGGVDPASPVSLTLAWFAANDHGLTASLNQSQVWRSNDQGATWQKQDGVQDASARTVAVTTADLNAWYTASTILAPLPIELVRFDARPRKLDAVLTWATASEKNAAYFVVERAPDARTWIAVGRVDAAGTSVNRHDYTLTDANIGARGPAFYYRLRQVDTDGSAAAFDIKLVQFTAPKLALDAYPVPMGEFLTLDLTAPAAGPLTVELVDATGRRVRQETRAALSGLNTWRLDTKDLPHGTYVLRATLNGETLTRRLLTSK
ncbi:MAG: T9SS type A sorting domain-containing protein [Hymenobacteraceae bacterium]|nr:T9SS type A sorting domain-containing protein [Hymenobacteraceae bacterium]